MIIKEALKLSTEKLNQTDSPRLDAEVLLSFIIKKPRTYLFTYPDKKITKKEEIKYKNFIKRRSKSEPVAYIIENKEFYSFNFIVSQNTLIPRPETELLIDKVKELLKTKINTTILDIGIGSGAIAITLKKLFPKIKVYGSEINPKTIITAKKNAKRLNTKIIIKSGNLLLPLIKEVRKYADNLIITANLPYLSEKEWQKTKPNVKLYEPKTALIGGKNGYELYEELFKQINIAKKNIKKYNINIFIEIGDKQKNIITTLAKKYFNLKKIKFYKDLAGKWRVANIMISN